MPRTESTESGKAEPALTAISPLTLSPRLPPAPLPEWMTPPVPPTASGSSEPSQSTGPVLATPTLGAPDSSPPDSNRTAVLGAAGPPAAPGQRKVPAAEYSVEDTPDRRIDRNLAWDYCGPRPARLGPLPARSKSAEDEPVYVDADSVEYDRNEDMVRLRGGIILDRGDQHIEAEELTYNRETGDLVMVGRSYMGQSGLRLTGDDGRYNLETDRGAVHNANYRFTGASNLRGSAQDVEIVSSSLTRYQDIIYSTCRPGNDDWTLKASKLELDQDTGVGKARHARIRLRGIPVLYTPYISFPIDDRRKSGLLMPSIASSDENGFEVTTPYYWNISPAMDATFFPRVMSERGAMLGAEFRYLNKWQQGEIYGEILPNDRKSELETTRWALRWADNGNIAPSWSHDILINSVSDDQYLEDFGNSLESSSLRNLEQRGALSYGGKGWSLSTKVQAFQTIDATLPATLRPYGRVPQVQFRLNRQRTKVGLEYDFVGEYDYFDHNHKVHGNRLAVVPELSWPLRRSYGHLIPSARLHASAYGLKGAAEDEPDNPSHLIPSLDLDGRLIFDRRLDWFGTQSTQTLEPRLYYLYTPYHDQMDTPVFDSSELSFDFNSLFRSNRFTGYDRIGDANQVTLGLTSRTIDNDTGRELLRASIGQIYYFEDRQVQIRGPAEDTTESSVAGELSLRLFEDLSGSASFQWNPYADEDQWEKRAVRLHYETPDERVLNLSYNFDLGASEALRYEDADLSFSLPVGRNTEIVGRWLYSMLHEETMDAFAGIEFGRCCWAVRLLGRHFKNKPDSNGNTTVMLQLELAGLGSFGHQVDKFLERGIYGYHAD